MNTFTACVPFLILALLLLVGSWAALLLKKPNPRYFLNAREVDVVRFSKVEGLAEVVYLDTGEHVVAQMRKLAKV